MATRPFTYRWSLQQAGTQVFTQVGTGESYALTMPDNREVRLRVEVSDAANHRVTAEAYIACNACALPVIAATVPSAPDKNGASLTSSSTASMAVELPYCADGIVQTFQANQNRHSHLTSGQNPMSST